MSTIEIAPSILSADFSKLGEEVRAVEKAGANFIHLDVMDGHFVDNLTMGPIIAKAVTKSVQIPAEAHLMIENPEKYIEPFSQAGVFMITFHIEVMTPEKAVQLAKEIQKLQVLPAISLNPATPLSSIEKILEHFKMVLIMSVVPGFGGQAFMPEILPKISNLRKIVNEKRLDLKVAVDGGINLKTAPLAIAAGADTLIAGSAVFKAPDYVKAIHGLKVS